METMLMTTEARTIAAEIDQYISGHGDSYSVWYAGIAKDARQRLFQDHNVDENGAWIFHAASTSRIAREVEDYLINVKGTDGGQGGGDDSTKTVYAYRKGPRTRE